MLARMTQQVGQWCFRRRAWVLAGWVVVVAGGALAAGPVVDGLSSQEIPRQVESAQARSVVETATGTSGELVALIDGIDTAAPAARAAVDRVAADLGTRSDVRHVDTVYLTDRPAAVLVITLAALSDKQRDASVDAVTTRLHTSGVALRADGQPTARIRVGGDLAVGRAALVAEDSDLELGEELALPLTLLALIVIFGGLVAAGLPVLGAVVSIASSMLMLLGFAAFTRLDNNVLTVVSLLGLGLSIDYGLLLVTRFRAEIRAGHPAETAIGRAWATAGRTVAFSALTVSAALCGLFAFDLPGLSTLGAAGVSVALVAMLVALTFTAALIGFTHRRLARRIRPAGGDAGFFHRVATMVQRGPIMVALGATGLLLVVAAPLWRGSLALPGIAAMPAGIESVQVAHELAGLPGFDTSRQLTVVVRAGTSVVDEWATRWVGDPAVAGVSPARAVAGDLSVVDVTIAAGASAADARDLVDRIRAARPPGVQSYVTSDAAELIDLRGVVADGAPWAVGIAFLAMLVLLLAMTGSLVVPLKAILANVLSIGATLGLMSGIFVHGWLSGPLHTITVSGLDPFVVVIVVAFAFGLSMDYEVFLLTRIKEHVDTGLDTDAAVRTGLQDSGRVITSAALLMMIVFACFGGARMGSIEELGIGLTAAVLIDATVVRCLLVPATMTLLGRWNWWSPFHRAPIAPPLVSDVLR